MKKIILTLGLVTFLGLSVTSCSTDDSALDNKQTSADNTIVLGNGDRELPRPTGPRL
jgi:hypothetical protein